MMKVGIFGYGSIINLKSAEKTLGRKIKKTEVIIGRLKHYVRIWDTVADVLIEGDATPSHAAFYNIKKQNKSKVNGIIIKLQNKEIDYLDKREKQYKRIDVTDNITTKMDCDKIFTYVGQEKFSAKNYLNVIILEEYQKIVNNGKKYWGETFTKEFDDNMQNNNFKIISGKYSFLDSEQNNLTGHKSLNK